MSNQQAVSIVQALDALYPTAQPAAPEGESSAMAPVTPQNLQMALVEELRDLRQTSTMQLAVLERLLTENTLMREQLSALGSVHALTDVVHEMANDLRTQMNEIKQVAGPAASQRIINLVTPIYEGLTELKTLQERSAKRQVNIEPLLDKTLELSKQKVELERQHEAVQEEKGLLEDYNRMIKAKLDNYGRITPEEMAIITRLKEENERLKVKQSLLARQLEREREERKRQGLWSRLFGKG